MTRYRSVKKKPVKKKKELKMAHKEEKKAEKEIKIEKKAEPKEDTNTISNEGNPV